MNNIAALLLQSSAPSKGGAPKAFIQSGQPSGFAPGAPIVFESLSGLPTPSTGRGGTLTSQTAVAVQSGDQLLAPGAAPVTFPAKAETAKAATTGQSANVPQTDGQQTATATPNLAQIGQNTHIGQAVTSTIAAPQTAQGNLAPSPALNAESAKTPTQAEVKPAPAATPAAPATTSASPQIALGRTTEAPLEHPAAPQTTGTTAVVSGGAHTTNDAPQQVAQANTQPAETDQPALRDATPAVTAINTGRAVQSTVNNEQDPVSKPDTPTLLQSEKVSAVLLNPDMHPVPQAANQGRNIVLSVQPQPENTTAQAPIGSKGPETPVTSGAARATPQPTQGVAQQANLANAGTIISAPSEAETPAAQHPHVAPPATGEIPTMPQPRGSSTGGEAAVDDVDVTPKAATAPASVQLFAKTDTAATPKPANVAAPITTDGQTVAPETSRAPQAGTGQMGSPTPSSAGQTPATTAPVEIAPAQTGHPQTAAATVSNLVVKNIQTPSNPAGATQNSPSTGTVAAPQGQLTPGTAPQAEQRSVATPGGQLQSSVTSQVSPPAQTTANAQTVPATQQSPAAVATSQRATPLAAANSGPTSQPNQGPYPQLTPQPMVQFAERQTAQAQQLPNSAPEPARVTAGPAVGETPQVQPTGQPAAVATSQSATSLIAAHSPAAPAVPPQHASSTPARPVGNTRDGQTERAAPLAQVTTAPTASIAMQNLEPKPQAQQVASGTVPNATTGLGNEPTAQPQTGLVQTGPQATPAFAAQQVQVAELPTQAQGFAPEAEAPTLPSPPPLRGEVGLTPAATQKSAPTDDKPSTGPRKFAEALTAQIKAADVNQERTRVALNPRGLGHIDIEIRGDAETGLKVTVRAENPTVLQSLRDERGMLAQAIGVSDGSDLEFQERQRDDHAGWTGDQQSHGPDDIDGDLDDVGSTAITARSDVIDGRQLDITT